MKRLILAITVALSLSACGSLRALDSIGLTPQAPAPLAATTIDDSALLNAWKAFDVALDAINLYIDAKPSVIGTPGAKRLADAIDAVTHALTAAEKAAAAGSSTSYLTALAEGKVALTEMRAAITAMKGN